MKVKVTNSTSESKNVILFGDFVFPNKHIEDGVSIEYSELTEKFKLDNFCLNVNVNSDKYFDLTKAIYVKRVEYSFKSELRIELLGWVIPSDYEEYKKQTTKKELSLDYSDKRFKSFDKFDFIELEINAGAEIEIEIKEVERKLDGFKFL